MNSWIEKGKALLASKTFWFGVLAIATGVARVSGYDSYEPTELVESVLTIIAGIGAIYGRTVATRSISRLL